MITFRPYADVFSTLSSVPFSSNRQRTAPVSLRARGRRGSGAVPLSLQKNAKGGEQSAQLADAQTSAACPLTHSPASQEEARLPAQRVCARRLTGTYLYPIYFPQIARISSHISLDVFPSVAIVTSAASSYFGLRFSISSSIYPTFIFPFSIGLSVLSFTRS